MTQNGESEQQRHRPGVFKQQNKAHKTGRHRSKGSLEVANKGMKNVSLNCLLPDYISLSSLSIPPSHLSFTGRVQKVSVKRINRELGGDARRNRAVQLRKNKREEFLKLVRSQNDPPFVIALVSLSNNISYFDTLDKLKNCDPEANVTYAENGYTVVR